MNQPWIYMYSPYWLGSLKFECWCVWHCLRGLWDYPQFFSFFFLLYSSLQKLFPPFYLPAHWLILLLQIFWYWFLLEYFLISLIVFVSVCLFFNSSRSLLIDCHIFSILFSRFLIIFTIIMLNSFSGNLHFLFIYLDFSISSLFLHLCSTSLPFYFIFLTYCVWGFLFPGFKVEFILPFGFCPPKVSAVVCVSFA